MQRPVAALVGALDTKGEEYAYLRHVLADLGCEVLLVDVGVLGEPAVPADVPREDVARAAGRDIGDLRVGADRNTAMAAMADGAARIVERHHARGAVDAVMAVGGSNAGYVMSVVCERLPIGLPKLVVSTIAAGDTTPYVGQVDLTLMYPVVDINGLNRLTRQILTNAARACAGMASGRLAAHEAADRPREDDAPLVAISMFGVTTACGTRVRELLAEAGIEALTFHATGVGGRSMEALIRSGHIQGVVDITTTELADELAGGVCSAGPDRLTAAAATGTPQVVSLGALDMVNFGARETVPSRYADRLLHQHNPAVTLMRTDVDECAELGRRLAARLNVSTGPVAVLIPTGGLSQISTPGQVFCDPAADAALIDTLAAHLADDIEVRRFDSDINHPQLATAAAELMITWLKGDGS